MDLALNPITMDLDFTTQRSCRRVDGLEYVAQRLKIRLSMQRGSWFLDQRVGVPWLPTIYKRKPDLLEIGALLRAEILSTPEVIRLDRFDLSFNLNTGLLTLLFHAVTRFGVLILESESEDLASLITLLLLKPSSGIA